EPLARRVESARPALESATLPLRQAAPDAEPLVIGQGVAQAFGADLAAGADLLGLAGGPALLREEGLRIGLRAQGTVVPILVLRSLVDTDERGIRLVRLPLVHVCP